MFFKDNANNIIKTGPAHYGATAPNSSPAVSGSTGNSIGEAWLDSGLTPPGWKIWNGSAWVNATPLSSDTVQGLVELATNVETQAGVDAARAVTAAGLQSKVSDSVSTTSASGIASSTAVKTAYDLANAALPRSGGIVTGNLEIGSTGSLSFEGTTADGFETTLTVVDPTADRTITFPNTTGTVITTGDTNVITSAMLVDGTIVDADINASAEIAVSKLADGDARQLLQTDAAGTGVEWTSNVAVPGTLMVASGASFAAPIAIPSGTAAAPSIYFTGDANSAGIYSPAPGQLGISANGTQQVCITPSGLVGLGGITAPTAALELAGQTTLSNASDAFGIKIQNSSVKTYPASGGTVYGSFQEYDVSNTTAITSPTVSVIGNQVSLRKNTGNVQDVEGLSLTGIRVNCIWFDANTCKSYTESGGIFLYSGLDANSRTSTAFSATSVVLATPNLGTQTVATVTSPFLNITGPGGATTATTNVTNWYGYVPPRINFVNIVSATRTANVTNASFYDTSEIWGTTGTGTGSTATITNLYGLRLRPPASTTGLTITNNWGLYQEWSSAKNWFAAESNQFPNITTTASSANVFVDSADSNRLYRSTSSSVYKKNVESLDIIAADKILDLRPVWYRSKCQNDRKDWSWYGLIAEEVAQIDPRFVHYGYQEDAYELVDVKQVVTLQEGDLRRENGKETDEIVTKRKQLKKDAKLVPNGIAYERLTVPLIDIAKRQKDQLAAQQELINDLLARVSALEGKGAA
jgi:hypothetical protein